MKKFLSMALALAMMMTLLAGCGAAASTEEVSGETASAYDKNVDFLVIGAGGSGLAAAVEAKDHGVENVLVVEKLSTIGGTTFISQGMIAGFDSKVQKAEGSVPTSFDEMYANLMNNASYRLDSKLAKITVERSGQTVDWLVDRLEMPFMEDVLVGYGPLEMMHVVEGAGEGMRAPFQNALDAGGIEVMTETTATRILTNENGDPVAVKCITKDGEITIGAKAIMIATGGYANNPELTARLDPEFKGTFGIGFGSCTGDGLVMASNVGAALTHTGHLMAVLKDYEIMAEHNGNSGTASVSRLIGGAQNLIFVGAEGTRFTNERDLGYMSQDLNRPIFDQMHKDDMGYVWAISDEATVAELGVKRGLEMEFVKGDTIDELAEKIGVDAAALTETINNYNKSVAAGFDAEFKRTPDQGLTELKAPYIANAVVPCEIITYGGVARNEWAEVIRADGTTIPGLYVAGEAAANSAYMGFTISNALTWGRIAGESAADYILGNEKRPSPAGEEAAAPAEDAASAPSEEAAAPAELKDGEYTATVAGQEGDMTVKTVIAEGKIASVEIVENHETPTVAGSALESVPAAIVEANAAKVDAIAGATLTSNRIMDAVADCLTQAAA